MENITYRSPAVTREYEAKQQTDAWLRARMGKLTGSSAYKLMTNPRTKAAKEAGELSETTKEYILEKACEIVTGEPIEIYQTVAMLRGIELEPEARSAYSEFKECPVEEIGFHEGKIPGTGCSVDGVVDGEGIIEIKCPEKTGHMSNLLITSAGDIDKRAYYQMQWNMWITGTSWCDFVSYNPDFPPGLRLKVIRLLPDEAAHAEFEVRAPRALAMRDDVISKITGS